MIDVVFATHNGARTLPLMLEQMELLRAPSSGWRILAVDNGSTDNTRAVLESFRTRLPLSIFTHSEPGKNAALNSVIPSATADLIVFTDDDILPEPDWLVQYERIAADQRDFHVFGGSITPEWMIPPPSWIYRYQEFFGACYGMTHGGHRRGEIVPNLIWGANMMLRRAIFDRGYLFNANRGPKSGAQYVMGSETELTRRLAAAGFRCYFDPKPSVRHLIRPEQIRRRWMLGRAYRLGLTQGANAKAQRDSAHCIHYFGAPRFLYRQFMLALGKSIGWASLFQFERAFRNQWDVCRLAGVIRQYRQGYP